MTITLKNLNLNYPIMGGTYSRLFAKQVLSLVSAGTIKSNNNVRYVSALTDINLSLVEGDKLAIIGGNGAGKTTLLKVISGIYTPTSGVRDIDGIVTPILGSGFGLDDESDGYENIIMGGIALGHSRKEMISRINDIAEFTELGEFLNLPFRTYSAGMKARLAFAITTSMDPDILAIDEGIGAGDESFLNKAQQRIESLYSKARIMILATHDAGLLKQLCNKAIVMKNGQIVYQGDVQSALDFYHSKY